MKHLGRLIFNLALLTHLSEKKKPISFLTMRMRSWTISLLIAALSSSLPILTAAQETEGCTVCQDGSKIRSPNVLVEELDQTCADLEEEASYYADPISCRYYHRYGNHCGCSNRPPAETFCELCQDSTPIPDSDQQLDGYDVTCGTLQVDAAWNLWHTFDENMGVDIQDQGNCNYYHHAGQLCGCRNNRPPATGCHLCADGSAPRSGRKGITPGDAAEETCQAYSLFAHYIQVEGTPECDDTQSVLGPYCGCSETPDTTTSNAEVCEFCPTGMVTKDGWAPDLDLSQGKRVFYFRDAACIKVAMLATEFGFSCSDMSVDFVDACCEPDPELLNTQVFIQDEPSVTQDADDDDTPELDWSSVIILTTVPPAESSSLKLGALVSLGMSTMFAMTALLQ